MHRLTKPSHPWSDENQETVRETVCLRNGQGERMSRIRKDATVKRYHYKTHDQLKTHLQLFLDTYKHAKRLKTFKGIKTLRIHLQNMDRRTRKGHLRSE